MKKNQIYFEIFRSKIIASLGLYFNKKSRYFIAVWRVEKNI